MTNERNFAILDSQNGLVAFSEAEVRYILIGGFILRVSIDRKYYRVGQELLLTDLVSPVLIYKISNTLHSA